MFLLIRVLSVQGANAMQNIFAQLTALVIVLITVAVFVEAILESLAPLMAQIQDVSIRTTANLLAGAVLGVLTAWGMGLRIEAYITALPLTIPAVASYILIGCAAGAGGSRFWHAVLGFLENFKLPVVPIDPALPAK
jgi:hypothetical protein